MITYKYKCSNCHHKFEIKQKISDDKLKHCNKCATDNLERIIQKSDFVLKGDGWFKTGGY